METISVESTLGTTSSFSLIVSVIVTGSGRTISSSSKIPKIYRKERTIMLVIIEVPKQGLLKIYFFGYFPQLSQKYIFFVQTILVVQSFLHSFYIY